MRYAIVLVATALLCTTPPKESLAAGGWAKRAARKVFGSRPGRTKRYTFSDDGRRNAARDNVDRVNEQGHSRNGLRSAGRLLWHSSATHLVQGGLNALNNAGQNGKNLLKRIGARIKVTTPIRQIRLGNHLLNTVVGNEKYLEGAPPDLAKYYGPKWKTAKKANTAPVTAAETTVEKTQPVTAAETTVEKTQPVKQKKVEKKKGKRKSYPRDKQGKLRKVETLIGKALGQIEVAGKLNGKQVRRLVTRLEGKFNKSLKRGTENWKRANSKVRKTLEENSYEIGSLVGNANSDIVSFIIGGDADTVQYLDYHMPSGKYELVSERMKKAAPEKSEPSGGADAADANEDVLAKLIEQELNTAQNPTQNPTQNNDITTGRAKTKKQNIDARKTRNTSQGLMNHVRTLQKNYGDKKAQKAIVDIIKSGGSLPEKVAEGIAKVVEKKTKGVYSPPGPKLRSRLNDKGLKIGDYYSEGKVSGIIVGGWTAGVKSLDILSVKNGNLQFQRVEGYFK